MLSFILAFLFCSILVLTFINQNNNQLIKKFSLIVSSILVILSIDLLLRFNSSFFSFQFIEQYTFSTQAFNVNFVFGLDGISIFLFVLTALLIFLSILYILNEKLLKYYVLTLFGKGLLLFLVFLFKNNLCITLNSSNVYLKI